MGACISQAKYRAVAVVLAAKIPRNLGGGGGPPSCEPAGVSAKAGLGGGRAGQAWGPVELRWGWGRAGPGEGKGAVCFRIRLAPAGASGCRPACPLSCLRAGPRGHTSGPSGSWLCPPPSPQFPRGPWPLRPSRCLVPQLVKLLPGAEGAGLEVDPSPQPPQPLSDGSFLCH